MDEAKPGKTKRVILMTVAAVLGVLLVAAVGVAIYTGYLLNRLNYVDDQETWATLSQEEIDAAQQGDETADTLYPEIDEESIFWEEADQSIGGADDIVNILLIGQDRRPGEIRTRSDSLILVTFNKVKKTITMTSFMRDMYVDLPEGYLDNRINVAYYFEGMEFLNETLELNFGVKVDANFEVDFDQFKNLINLLGGVELELTASEVRYINERVPGSDLQEGKNRLNGAQALWHARNRTSGGNGDFGRTNRQRDVLYTLLNTYKNMTLREAVGMLDDILPMLTTDLERSEILGYVATLFPMLAECQIITQGIPVEGGYYMANIRGMSVLVPNMEVNRQALIDSLTNLDQESMN